MDDKKSSISEVFLKKKIRYLMITCCTIVGIYFLLMVFLIMMVGNQPIGPKTFDYSIHYQETNVKKIQSFDILLPIVVNESGVPVFTETELNNFIHSNLQDPSREAYNISLISTDNGPMMSVNVKPNPDMPDMHGIGIYLRTDEVRGNSFSLSPVLENRTSLFSKSSILPVYANSTNPGSSSASININFRVCGYDANHPYDCKGYSTGPDSRSQKTQGYYPVELSEFGTLNDLRHVNPLMLPVEYFNRMSIRI
jgi:hypothetical protein